MWTCKEGCHAQEGFQAVQYEDRTDTIVHAAPRDSQDFEFTGKVHVGLDSTWSDPECGVCERPLEWVDKETS